MTSSSLPAPERPPGRRPLTETERNWLRSVLILWGGVALFSAAKLLEERIGVPDGGGPFFKSPGTTYMRFIGIAHFLVAYYFTFTSRGWKGAQSWAEFLALLALGGLLCLGYHWLDARSGFAAYVAFFSYFLIHDTRDQVFFYFRNGDGPGSMDRQAFARALVCLPFLVVAGLTALAATLVLGGVPGVEPRVVAAVRSQVPADLQWLFAAVPLLLFVGLWLAMRTALGRAAPGGLRSRLRAHRPIYVVLGGTLAIFLALAVLDLGLSSIVILHVASWYVFTARQLGRRPAFEAHRFTGQWFRNTATGFGTLHIGLAVVLLGLGAVWAWGYGSSDEIWPLWLLLDERTFPYWTIVHVTVSFRPR